MYKKLSFIKSEPWTAIFDDVDLGTPPPAETPAETPEPTPVDFSPQLQAAIDQKTKEIEANYKDKTSKVLSEMDTLRKRSDLTQGQRNDLEKSAEALRQELLTKEELFEQDKKKRDKKYQTELEAATKESAIWKTRYEESTVVRDITDASSRHAAFDNDTIVAILRPNTQLVPVLDKDSNATGQFEVKVKFVDPEGTDGKPTELFLAVPDAVKRMSELDKYKYLFRGQGVGGIGGSSRSGADPVNLMNVAKDQAEYMRLRKSGEIKMGDK